MGLRPLDPIFQEEKRTGAIQVGNSPGAFFACFTYQWSVFAGLDVDFDASCTVTPDGLPAVAWDWDFGDTNTDTSGPTTSHSYASSGSYTVTLRVQANDGTWSAPVARTVIVLDSTLLELHWDASAPGVITTSPFNWVGLGPISMVGLFGLDPTPDRTIGGLTAVDCNSSKVPGATTNPLGRPQIGDSILGFIVADLDTTSSPAHGLLGKSGNTSVNGNWALMTSSAPSVFASVRHGTALHQCSTSFNVLGGPAIYTVEINMVSSTRVLTVRARRSGEISSNSNTFSGGADPSSDTGEFRPMRRMENNSLGQNGDGAVGEVGLLRRTGGPFTVDEVEAIENYMIQKWNL